MSPTNSYRYVLKSDLVMLIFTPLISFVNGVVAQKWRQPINRISHFNAKIPQRTASFYGGSSLHSIPPNTPTNSFCNLRFYCPYTDRYVNIMGINYLVNNLILTMTLNRIFQALVHTATHTHRNMWITASSQAENHSWVLRSNSSAGWQAAA